MAVSTAAAVSRQGGLLGAVEEILALGCGLVEIAAPAGAGDHAAAARRLAAARGRCLAVAAPLVAPSALRARADDVSISSPRPEAALRGLRELEATLEVAAGFRCDLVVVDAGRLRGAGEEDPAEELIEAVEAGDLEAASRRRETLRALVAGRREPAVERLCRCLWRILRERAGLTLALRLDADPAAVLDEESAAWILGEFDPRRLGLMHDLGGAVVRERLGFEPCGVWSERFGDRVLGAYVSDVAGVRDGLPPGAGTADLREMGRELSPATPRILKLAPGTGRLTLAGGLAALVR